MTFEVWHVTDDGERMRRLGDGPGRKRDKAGRWRPVDQANPGPSPNNLLRKVSSGLRAGGELTDRPLRELYADLDARKTLTGRDADRLIADTEQGRRFYGAQVPKRSEVLDLFDNAIANGASKTDAIRQVAVETLMKEDYVRQAVDRRRQTPPSRRISALYQVDQNGEYQLIHDFSHRAGDQRRDQ